jgi:hypothetical protein
VISNKGLGRWSGASSFGDAIAYIRRVDDATAPLAEWSEGVASIETAAAEMTAVWQCSQVVNAVDHRIISWARYERPSIEEARAAARTFVREIGYGPTVQFVAAMHDDGRSGMVHLHVVANRVEPVQQRVVELYDDYRKGRSAMRELEREQGWREVPDETLERASVERVETPRTLLLSAGHDRYGARQTWRRYVREEIGPVFREAWERAETTLRDVGEMLLELEVPAKIEAVYRETRHGIEVVGARVTSIVSGVAASVADLGVKARSFVERWREELAAEQRAAEGVREGVRDRAARSAAAIEKLPRSATWRDVHDAFDREGLVYEPWLKHAARVADPATRASVKATEVDGLSRVELEKRFGSFIGTAASAAREAERLLIQARNEQKVAQTLARSPEPLIASLFDKDATIGLGAIELDLQERFTSASSRSIVREALLDRMVGVAMPREGWVEVRLTTPAFIEEGRRVKSAAAALLGQQTPAIAREYVGPALVPTGDAHRDQVLGELREQSRAAYGVATSTEGRLKVITGVGGAGKTTLLQEVADGWRSIGYDVRAVSVITQAVKILRNETDIPSRTAASELARWERGYGLPNERTVIVIDEVSSLGSAQGARLLEVALERGATVLAFGDDKQCPSVARGNTLALLQQAYAERGESIFDMELTARQRIEWMRKATHDLRAGRVAEGLSAYRDHGALHEALTRAEATSALVERWQQYLQDGHDVAIAVLTNADRRDVNALCRGVMRELGRLEGNDVALNTLDGRCLYAVGDRVRARKVLENPDPLGEKLLGNGVEATVARIDGATLFLRWKNDRDEWRETAWNTLQNPDLEHAYATTTQREQGRTGWGELMLLNGSVRNQTLMVGASRHQYAFEAFYAREDFKGGFADVVRRAERFDVKENAVDGRELGDARGAIALAREAAAARRGEHFVEEHELANDLDDALALAG